MGESRLSTGQYIGGFGHVQRSGRGVGAAHTASLTLLARALRPSCAQVVSAHHDASGSRVNRQRAVIGVIAGGRRGGRLTARGHDGVVGMNIPAALESSGSQWAIKLSDGRIVPTGTDQERTERDAQWENSNAHGHGGCSVVVRDSYRTLWHLADDSAPLASAGGEVIRAQSGELVALQAQVTRLADSLAYYRHLAMRQVQAYTLPNASGKDTQLTAHRRLRVVAGPMAELGNDDDLYLDA